MGVSVEVRPAGGRKLREGDWGLGDVDRGVFLSRSEERRVGKECVP